MSAVLAFLQTLVLVVAVNGGTPVPAVSPLPGVVHAQRAARELRERLSQAPAPERERLERHLAEFEKLQPPARRKLLERAKTLRERELSLGPAPVKQKAGLRDEMRAQGREVRQRLPEGLRKRLERAEPEQRRRLLERLVLERERLSREAIEAMRERLRLSPLEVWRLERLPVEQRLRALRELGGKPGGRTRR